MESWTLPPSRRDDSLVPVAPEHPPISEPRRIWHPLEIAAFAALIGSVLAVGIWRLGAPTLPLTPAPASAPEPVVLEGEPRPMEREAVPYAPPTAEPRTEASSEVPATPAPAPAWARPGKQAPPPRAPEPGESIDRQAAASAVDLAAYAAAACLDPDDARTTMAVAVTFLPSGVATTAVLEGGPFLGSETGGCIARMLRKARVPAFDGPPVTVHKSVKLR